MGKNEIKPPKNITTRIQHSTFGCESEDKLLRELHLKILECKQVVGTALIYIIDVDGAREAGESVLFLCDRYQETMDCGSVVFDRFRNTADFSPAIEKLSDGLPMSLNILLIPALQIDPAYRGRGIGLSAIAKIIRKWGAQCGIAVMQPFPLQFGGNITAENKWEFKIAQKKLIKYYAPLGFKQIPRTEYFVYNLDDALPEPFKE